MSGYQTSLILGSIWIAPHSTPLIGVVNAGLFFAIAVLAAVLENKHDR
jgi:hypothetical protein